MEYLFYGAIFAVLLIIALYAFLLVKRFAEVLYPDRTTKRGKWIGRLVIVILVAIVTVLCYFWDYGYALFIQAGLFCLIMEPVNWIVLLATRKTRGKKGYRVWRRIFGLSLIPLLAAGAFTVYGSYHIKDVKVNTYTVTSDKLTEDMNVLMVSDLHYPLVMTEERLESLISEMQDQNPDIVLLVGDMVDENTTKEQMEFVFSEFGSIKSTYGVYYVYGNHDDQQYETDKKYTTDELNAAAEAAGVILLRDETVQIRDDFVLAGRKDYSELRTDISDVLADVDPSDFILVMDHQPQEYEEEEEAGTDLVVSGHTHDGQLFPCGYAITLFHMADVTWGEGHFGNTTAIVSSGLVGWGFPIRTQGDSEYVMIHLTPQ